MQYLRFYKDRLPFKPKSNVVIYFDVMGVVNKKQKPYFDILDDLYDEIVAEFRQGGLEFCFLPRIARDMDLNKIYHYFNPQASEEDRIPYFNLYYDRDLLEYMVADYDERNLKPGLIQYMGEGFDTKDEYTFSYTPFPSNFEYMPFELIQRYVEQHGVREAFFARAVRECVFDRFLPKKSKESSAPLRSESSCVQRSNAVYDEEDVEMVMSEVQMLVERLRQSGVGEIALMRLFKPTQELSRIHVRYGRIFLPDYNNKEIKMPPLSKAIYMLYLRHPEGIKFAYLPDYREELLHLYELISGRESREDIRRSIDDVTDSTRNSINEKCSRIKQAFLREFDDSIAQHYYITGERGEAKKILLPREKVIWEMPR